MAIPRDETGEWIVPDREVPTIGELEDRIEVAISIARSSEAAAMTVADAALESAQQARRAAEVAERAARTVATSAPVAPPSPEAVEPLPEQGGQPPEATEQPRVHRNGSAPRWRGSEEWLVDFSQRADRLGARFAKLTRV